jgi:hypothetical protein
MKVEERWTFGLFVVMVNLHASHLCCLFFMVDQGVNDCFEGFYGGGKLVEL